MEGERGRGDIKSGEANIYFTVLLGFVLCGGLVFELLKMFF